MKKQMKMVQGGNTRFTGSLLLRKLLVLCVALSIVPAAAQKTSKPALYKVEKATDGYFDTPYRAAADGDVIGEMPKWAVYETVAFEDNWAKVKYKGGEYYIPMEGLKKADTPDMVCSAWAKEWLSYDGIYRGIAGEWTGAADDWTKPITRSDMAHMLVDDIMACLYPDCKKLPHAVRNGGKSLFSDTADSKAGLLAYWGVVPMGAFNPTGSVTYDEFTALLVKLMAYDRRYVREGGGSEFTKADIAKFAIGGNKGPKAKCTKEQARILCDKVLCWRTEMELLIGAKHEDSEGYDGTVYVYNGVYTIKTLLGEKPGQPGLFVNAEGKVELNSGPKQKFKITYRKSMFNKDREVVHLYTIQTLEGKYLGISGTPVNGSRLAAQKAEFLWQIEHGPSCDGQMTTFIEDPNNYHQVLNASQWKTADGTPVITWYWKHGTGSDSDNCKFIFSKVK